MRIIFLALGLSLLIGCSQKSSEDHLHSAQQFVEQKKLKSAVVELKNAVQLEPRNPKARFELGKVYLMQKQYESAEKELNRALEYGQPAPDVIPLLSQAYQNSGAYAELSQIDHSEAGMSPEQKVEVGFFKIQSLVQLDKVDEAKALISELQNEDVDTVYKGLINIYSQVLDEQLDAAVTTTENLVTTYPENTDLLKLQGQLYLRMNEPQKAADVYTKYLQLYPEDSQTVFVLAKILVDSGEVVKAEPYIDQLLEFNQENPLLNQLKSIVSAAKEEHQDAQNYAEKAIQSGRGDPVLRLIAGHAAYILKDYEAANTHLSYIASSLPPEHPGLKMLAASQLELGMSGEASEVLQDFDNVSEQDARLFSKAGYELIRAGNIKEAQKVVERSAQISRTAEDLTRLGVLRLSLNDIEGIVDLEKALEQKPELDVTRATLAKAYIATNQLEKAAELATEWKQSDPDDFKGYLLAGEVALKQQQFEQAANEYQQAEKIDPENGLIKLALANLALTQGEIENGVSQLEAILAKKSDFVPAIASYYLAKRQQGEATAGMQPALQALQANPESQQLKLLVARMQLNQKDWSEALSTLDGMENEDSVSLAFWSTKGKALLGLGVITDANDHFDKWLAEYPNNKEANVGKMLLLDARSEFVEGASLSDAFLQKRDDITVQMMNVHFLVMSGEYQKAKQAYQQLPSEAKELPVAKGFQARILLSDNKPQEALEFSRQVYDSIPNSRNAVLLAINLERVDRPQDALDFLASHTQQFPNDLPAKMMLAERQIADNENEAIATYEKSLQLNPNNFVVLNNLAYLYTQEGRLDEAENYARKAVEQRPNNADAVDTLAQALMKQEKYDEALRFYDRVINDKMQNNLIYLNYVEVLFASGNNSLARRKLAERNYTDPEMQAKADQIKQKYGV